ncbi:MAG: hypothetical protein QW096_10975 [Thermofilaceae archaeon]
MKQSTRVISVLVSASRLSLPVRRGLRRLAQRGDERYRFATNLPELIVEEARRQALE